MKKSFLLRRHSQIKKSDTRQERQAERAPVCKAAEYAALPEQEKELYQPIHPRSEHMPRACWVIYGIFALCLILYIIQGQSIAFSDWFNLYIGSAVRGFLAALTAWIPFSVGESVILLLPLGFGLMIRHGIRYHCDTWRSVGVYVAMILSVIAVILSIFVLGFSAGYRGSSLDIKLELEDEAVSPTELYDTAIILIQHINEETDKFGYFENGFSEMPYTLQEMNAKLSAAYDSFCVDYDFIRNNAGQPKPVLISEVMSYMHITGVYSFFTGESNINIGFPDYTVPYTAAHEMAHQRGISRENEANMVAFLVCIRSDDPYIRYSGYLNMYEYVASALYSADKDLYKRAVAHLNDEVNGELTAYSRFYEKYKESTASKVSGAVNNAYLQTQKVAVGTKSYGMVVDLTVAYYKAHP